MYTYWRAYCGTPSQRLRRGEGAPGQGKEFFFFAYILAIFSQWCDSCLRERGPLRYPRRCCSAKSHPRVPDRKSNQGVLPLSYTKPHTKVKINVKIYPPRPLGKVERPRQRLVVKQKDQRGLNTKRPKIVFFLGPTKPLPSYG
jgi:hypothetical protein